MSLPHAKLIAAAALATGVGISGGNTQAAPPAAGNAGMATPAAWPHFHCVAQASAVSQVPLSVLFAVWDVERGWPGAARRNTNGTYDYGLAQINTVRLPEAARLTGLPPERIVSDGCSSLFAAAQLIRHDWIRTGDLWRAVGNYHSKTPKRHHPYRDRVRLTAIRLEPAVRHQLALHGWAGTVYSY